MEEDSSRFIRQQNLYNPKDYEDIKICVIGCGAIGSAVAQCACRVGFNKIVLLDDDVVSEHNLPNQLFFEDQVDTSKVEAVAQTLARINSNTLIIPRHERVTPKTSLPEDDNTIFFVCPDSMESRNDIYKAIKRKKGILIDGRMNGMIYSIYGCNFADKSSVKDYESTLNFQSSAEGSCSQQSIIFNTFGVASDMVHIALQRAIKNEDIRVLTRELVSQRARVRIGNKKRCIVKCQEQEVQNYEQSSVKEQ